MIGRTISHYRILAKLGEGGMGVVYKAHDTRLDRPVALKFLPPQTTVSDQDMARLINEAKAAANLRHQNICPVYEICEADDQVFIVMAYLEGRSLRERLAAGALSLAEVLDIAIQVSDGLQEAHSEGIVHRDIKPANIMVTEKGEAVVMDFGIARKADATRLTRTGGMVGTAAFMSPEQVRGAAVDNRTDLWSLGVMLYEMLTGQRPFQGDNELTLMYAISNDDPELISAQRTEVPAALASLVKCLLEKVPDERPESAGSVAAELRRIAGGSEDTELLTAFAQRKPGRRGLRRWIPVLAVVILAGSALALWLKTRPGDEAAEEKTSLAVMYFQNVPDPGDSLRSAEIMTNLLITGLSEDRHLSVMSSQRLHDILRLLGSSGRDGVDQDLATEVARHAGAKYMVTGALLQAEPTLQLTAQLIEVATGTIAGSQRIQGSRGESIFDVADRLIGDLSSDLGFETPVGATQRPALAEITSQSSAAYRYYLDGVEYMNQWNYREARPSFERAIAADSSFVMAYYYLASRPNPDPRKKPLIETALRHADHATAKELALLQGLDDLLDGETDKAIQELDDLARTYPDDKEIFKLLGRIHRDYNFKFDYDAAFKYLERARELDPLDREVLDWLAYSYFFYGDDEKAREIAAVYLEAWPDLPDPYDVLGDLATNWGQCDEAIEYYRRVVDINPELYGVWGYLGRLYIHARNYEEAMTCFLNMAESDDYDTRTLSRVLQAQILTHQGRFRDALQHRGELLVALKMEGDRSTTWRAHVLKSRYIILCELESWEEADEAWQALLAHNPAQAKWSGLSRIMQLARQGQISAARQKLEMLAAEREEDDEYWNKYLHPYTLSILELHAGNAELALEAANIAAVDYDRSNYLHWDMNLYLAQGRALLANDLFAEAVPVFERIAHDCNTIYSRRANIRVYCYARYYLAVALEGTGENGRAIAQYHDFLELWKNADPELKIVHEARERLARLES